MWRLTTHTDWSDIAEAFSWIQDMRGVPQDAEYHAEGDVETHVRMVLHALENLEVYQALGEQDREVLRAAALLHDVEKRSTTRMESGRWTAPGHAKKGEQTARVLLYQEHDTPFLLRERIAKLVRHHGLPLWSLEKPDPVKATLRAAMEVNTHELALLAEADVLGRISESRQDFLLRVELFREQCRELNCYGNLPPFVNGQHAFHYFFKEDADPGYVPYSNFTCDVVMLSGLPGSGKDTWIRRNLTPDFPVVSLDAIRREWGADPSDTGATGRAVSAAREMAKTHLRNKVSFAWNATNLTRLMREQLVALFATYGARVRIVYIEQPWKIVLRQNREREHPVPETILHKMVSRWEPPAAWEAHEVVYVTG